MRNPVQMHIGGQAPVQVNTPHGDVKLVAAAGHFLNETQCNEAVTVGQVIGDHGRRWDDEDSQGHGVQSSWKVGILNLRPVETPDVA
jgi:hypothetical protein